MQRSLMLAGLIFSTPFKFRKNPEKFPKNDFSGKVRPNFQIFRKKILYVKHAKTLYLCGLREISEKTCKSRKTYFSENTMLQDKPF